MFWFSSLSFLLWLQAYKKKCWTQQLHRVQASHGILRANQDSCSFSMPLMSKHFLIGPSPRVVMKLGTIPSLQNQCSLILYANTILVKQLQTDSWKIILMNVLLLWFYCCKIKWIYEGPQKICFSFKGEYYYTLRLCLKANKSCDAIRGDCGSTGHCLLLCSSAGLIWESNQYLNIVQLWLFKDMFVL